MIRYLNDDLQRIVKTILEARSFPLPTSAPIPVFIVAAAPHYEGLREWPLKVRFPDIYWGKTHLECYNFFQQYKNHFAITGATDLNRVPFAAIFLKDTALFR